MVDIIHLSVGKEERMPKTARSCSTLNTFIEKEERKCSVGNHLMKRLYADGVRHLFGLPHQCLLPCFGSLLETHGISFVSTVVEGSAGYMADAYARICGIGALYVTRDTTTQVIHTTSRAYLERSPLVLLSLGGPRKNSKPSHHLHRGGHGWKSGGDETIDSMILSLHPWIVDGAQLHDPRTAFEEIDRVLASGRRHRRPVYLELLSESIDHCRELTPPSQETEWEEEEKEALEEFAHDLLHVLQECRRPFLLVGHEVQRFGLEKKVLDFAERFRIPIVSTLSGKGVIGEQHPLFVGVYRGNASRSSVSSFVEGCDSVITLGADPSHLPTSAEELWHLHRVYISCDHIGIDHHGYEEISFHEAVTVLSTLDTNLCFHLDYPAYIDSGSDPVSAKGEERLGVEQVSQCLEHLLPSPSLFITGKERSWDFADLLVDQGGFLACPHEEMVGFTTAAAIAAQLAKPKQRPLLLLKEEEFRAGAMELSTAILHRLSPILLILRSPPPSENRSNHSSPHHVVHWHYTELPRLFHGGEAIAVTTRSELHLALQKALAGTGKLWILDVHLKPHLREE